MEIECLGCRAVLRVEEKHAGRQARCPHCGYIQTVETPPDSLDQNRFERHQAKNRDSTSEEVRRSSESPQGQVVARNPSWHLPLLLILGVAGLGCSCPLFSIAAWVMSASDLRAMRLGQLDSARQDTTRVAYWLGLGGSLLWITISVIVSLVLLIRAGR